MSLARAIATGDLAELPSRRQEGLALERHPGLVRVLPDASPAHDGPLPPGPFAALGAESVEIVNGRGLASLVIEAGSRRTVALRVYAAGGGAHASRLAIDIGADAELVLLEHHAGEGGGVSQADLQITLEAGARLERIVIADEDAEAVSVSKAEVVLAPRSVLAQTVLTTGAKRQRLETRVSHPGSGASVRLDALYLASDRRHADVTTVVRHVGPDGATGQLAKGVAADRGRGVFQGLIEVAPGADRTEARMEHHALVLSDHAEIDAKPELVIFADDVVCTHGNTVGALDEEAMFYARQRGLPEPAARAMLMDAFLGEVADRIEHPGAREVARAWLAERAGP